MKKTWQETWGKISSDDDWSGWDGLTAKDIDKMVADGADVNEVHVYPTEEYTRGVYPKRIATSTYPLERAVTLSKLGVCKALIKHGAIPQLSFDLFENGQIKYEGILEGACLALSHSNVRYLVEEMKVPVTPKAILSAIRQEDQWSLKFLLNHFDLKAHPNLAKEFLKKNILYISGNNKTDIQSIIVGAMKKQTTKVQNSKIANLKSAKINSGR